MKLLAFLIFVGIGASVSAMAQTQSGTATAQPTVTQPSTTTAKTANKKAKGKTADVKKEATVAKMNDNQINQAIQQHMLKNPGHPYSAAEIAQLREQLKQKGKITSEPVPPSQLAPAHQGGQPVAQAQQQHAMSDLHPSAKGQKVPPALAAEQQQQAMLNNPNNPVPPVNNANTNNIPTSNPNNPDAPRFEFSNNNAYDYGELIEDNEPSPHEFEFTNVGKSPLIISEAHGSCGCTVPSFSKEPVLPGHKGVVTVKYSTKGRVGPFNKDVFITSNAVPSPVVLHISGTVKSNPNLGAADPKPAIAPATGTGNK